MMPAEQMQLPDIKPNHARSMLEGALFYASQGLNIHPLEENGKRPRTKWKEAATSDPDQIIAWWSKPGWENSNIGLVTGKKNNLIVIDLDRKDGKDGFASYRSLFPDGKQPEYRGPRSVTPGDERANNQGGSHLLFTYTDRFINFTSEGSSGGLDMRTDAGFIVVSPSRIEGKQYYWATVGQIPDMPQPLYDACVKWSSGGSERLEKTNMPPPADFIPSLDSLDLVPKYKNYLQYGDASPWDDDRSSALLAVAGVLLRATNDESTMFSVMTDNVHVIECAASHRPRDPEGWLWEHTCIKAVAGYKKYQEEGAVAEIKVEDHFKPSDTRRTPTDFMEVAEAEAKNIVPIKPTGPVKASSSNFWSLEEKISHTLPPPNWLIKGVIGQGSVGILYGDSTVGKTFMALDLSLHVACGRGWHRHRVKKPGRVMYVAGEGGEDIWLRAKAWFLGYNEHHLNAKGFEPVGLHSAIGGFHLTTVPMDMMQKNAGADLQKLVNELDDYPSLVVVDTLSVNMMGNENDSGDIARVINNCKTLNRVWGSTFLIVHHPNKGGELRGSGAIFNNSDFVMHMEAVEEAQARTVKLSVTKQKAGAASSPVFFELKTQIMIDEVDEEGYPLSTLSLKRVSRKETGVDIKTQVRLTETKTEILSCAREALGDSVLLDPSATQEVLSDDIWGVYMPFCDAKYGPDKKPRRRDFQNSLTALMKAGYLDVVELAGVSWYRMPRAIQAETENKEE